MAIIPIIFFALVFGLGSFFGPTESSFETSVEPAPPAAASASPVTPGTASQVQLPAKLVKQMFDNRQPLAPCGTIQGDDRGQQAWTCLQNASDPNAQGAELVRVATTTEGDPITMYYRVAHGALEIFTDNSQDRFRGDPAWTFETCMVPDDVRSLCTGS